MPNERAEFAWFLPTMGDHAGFGKPETAREATFAYLRDVARSAEAAGFGSALVPVGDGCEDAWVVASMLAGQTERLKFLVAVRPGFVAPTVAAKMVSTFDQLSGGRVFVNVVTGGFPAELAADGDFTPHDERYQRTAEFIAVMKKYWTEAAFDHAGEFFRVEGCRPLIPCATKPYPPLYAGGASDAAEDLFARDVDCYLLWGETIPQMGERIVRMRAKAAQYGRTLKFGVRFHVLARDTEEQARADAMGLIEGVSEEQVARAQAVLTTSDSAGEQRQRGLHRNDLWPEPNFFTGVGLVRRGIGATIVGSHEQVARKFREYTDLGLSYFILSGYPHREEARIAGTGWLPAFRALERRR